MAETVKKTKFQSPLPILIRLRNIVFGKTKPDIYTRLIFWINLLICIAFLVWCILGYLAIVSRELVFDVKEIDVEQIIEMRGKELGFEIGTFIERLTYLYIVGAISWIVFFIGLVLLYRKKVAFIYVTMLGFLTYLAMAMFYLGFQYFVEDTTLFDKICLLIAGLSLLLHGYFLLRKRRGEAPNFFGEAEED